MNDCSEFISVNSLEANEFLADPFTFFNGEPVESPDDWDLRAEEIRKLYQYYMYGVMPDASKEKVTYKVKEMSFI